MLASRSWRRGICWPVDVGEGVFVGQSKLEKGYLLASRSWRRGICWPVGEYSIVKQGKGLGGRGTQILSKSLIREEIVML